jgi:hypothetical protein
MAMICGDDAVDPLGALVLGGLEVAAEIPGDGALGGDPAGHRLAAMGELLPSRSSASTQMPKFGFAFIASADEDTTR